MTREEKIIVLSQALSPDKAFLEQAATRINEKTDEQLDYILSPIDKCIYLEACAGSGKTEVLGIKAAYEISRWASQQSGLAVLSFTNEATSTIANRIAHFYSKPIPSRHFIGTFSSFVHGYIAQRFGYNFFNIPREKDDKSFKIVEPDASPYSKQWLNNYKLEFPFPTQYYANQLNYKTRCDEWFIERSDNSISLTDLYSSEKNQKYIEDTRKRCNAPNLFQIDYLIRQVCKCKTKFLNSGFATFVDMNLIARKCLRNNAAICNYISKKFPVIMVDECQDLSASELGILDCLIRAGTIVHYIGDLHQAIYSFKDAYPEQFEQHIQQNGFLRMRLSENFRSTQSIVDLSRKLCGIDYPIVGHTNSKSDGCDCVYLEYTDESDAISKFIGLLKKYAIPFDAAAILVRTQSAKNKLSSGQAPDYLKHPIINAIQLWQKNEPSAQQAALNLLAYQLQKWLGTKGQKNNYYFSEEICSSPTTWRLLLRDILTAFCSQPSIINMDQTAYSAWYSANKKILIEIINFHLHSIGKELTTISIRTPPRSASQIIDRIDVKKEVPLRIDTIHSVKGSTFDAVLLLSTPDGKGKTGYWENWLSATDEAARIAYVACTRPRLLLVWGVSTLSSDGQRNKLESLGFSKFQE